jgi:heptaprenyl diphosphate synthase
VADFWRDAPAIRLELDGVREIIERELSTAGPELSGPLSELGAAEGKMLRPGLLIVASRFGSPVPEKIRRIAAAVEMFHLATLVHDDVIDGALSRRRRPTLNASRGARTAVLVGDYLFSRSFLVAAERVTNPSVQSLSSVIARVCASEIAQSEDLFRPSASVRRYLRRIAGKTAALFSASCHLGATESGCAVALSQALRRAGFCMGMAFQIVDDLLDISGESERLGKPVGQDLRAGVFTLPVVRALGRDPAQAHEGGRRHPLPRRDRAGAGRRGALHGARPPGAPSPARGGGAAHPRSDGARPPGKTRVGARRLRPLPSGRASRGGPRVGGTHQSTRRSGSARPAVHAYDPRADASLTSERAS